MFGKLKDKLKGALSVFSSKAEEEAEINEEVVEVSEEKIKEEKPKKEKKVEKKKESEKEKKEEKTKEEKKEKPKTPKKSKQKKEKTVDEKEEAVEEIKSTEEKVIDEEKVIEEPVEEVKEPEVAEEKEEPKEKKKGFFGKLFSKKEEEVPVEEVEKVIEEAEEKKKKEEVIEEKEAEPVEDKEELTEEVVEEPVEESTDEDEPGFFKKIKQSITTKRIGEDKFNELFWDLELILLENNVSVEVIEKIKEDLKEELVDKPLPRDVSAKIQATLQKTLKEILSFDKVDILEKAREKIKENKPYVIAFFGINGAGKTTSIAKLTHYLKENNLSVVLAACDTFRAAAIQQLGEHADKLDVKMIKHNYGSDAAAVAFDAIKHAEKEGTNVVLIDTAGRLHSNTNLMAELEKIIRVTKPDLKIFVGESITGNDCIEQARKFNELVEIDGAILTKADVDEKGGAPLSISYTINKPILFLGVGQEYKDLEVFDAGVILERLGF